MALTKKHVKYIAISGGILAAIAIVALIRFLKNRASGNTADYSAGSTKNIQPVKALPADFPIRNNSRGDLVKQLQELLGVKADGIFGPITTAALVAKTGKTSISSQAEFESVVKTLLAQKEREAVVAAASAKGQRSQKLINDYKANSSLKVVTLKSFRASRYTMDAYSVMHATGYGTDVKAQVTFPHDLLEMVGVGGSGDIRVKIDNGGIAPYIHSPLPDGYYLFHPDNITLVK